MVKEQKQPSELSAIQAKLEAQKIAFFPIAFEAIVDFPPWSLTIIATLEEFNDMDSVEVLLWQRNGSAAFD